jgi:purine-binding chemotaxis protein CheW
MPEHKPETPTEPFILFELAGTSYGLRSRSVQQMEMIEHITSVPNAPPFIEGVVFSRGQVIPAVNLRVRFGFPKKAFDLRTRLVVVSHNGRAVGLIVDSCREFTALPTGSVQPPPEAVTGLSGQYLEGIAKIGQRLVLVLDVGEVLNLSATALATVPHVAAAVDETGASSQ